MTQPGAGDPWRWGIGDPSVHGWVTVLGYAGASVLTCRALRLQRAGGGPANASRELSLRAFWFLVLCALLALGVNKQLDLQSWLTEAGRELAQAQGWFGKRREVQALFVTVVGVIGLAVWM